MKVKVTSEVDINDEELKRLEEEFNKSTFYGDKNVDLKTKIVYFIVYNGVCDLHNLMYDLKYLERCRNKEKRYL